MSSAKGNRERRDGTRNTGRRKPLPVMEKVVCMWKERETSHVGGEEEEKWENRVNDPWFH